MGRWINLDNWTGIVGCLRQTWREFTDGGDKREAPSQGEEQAQAQAQTTA